MTAPMFDRKPGWKTTTGRGVATGQFAVPPRIDGALAVTLGLKGFRPFRSRPDNVWVRGRRASGRRVAAILEDDGSLILHRQSRRGSHFENVPDAAENSVAISGALRRVLDA